MENCVVMEKGVAELYIVDPDKSTCQCMACSFDPVEDIFTGILHGADEEELEEYARSYWASCKPWKGEWEPDTEVLCWCEPQKILVGKADSREEIQKVIEKAKQILARPMRYIM